MMLYRRLAALTILMTCVCFAAEARAAETQGAETRGAEVRGVVVTDESEAPPIAKPHEELECKSCHKSHSMVLPEENSAPCIKCHENQTGKDSHPTGVDYEGAAPPEGLPLSKDDKLTCGTCHILHKTEAPDPPRALLRKKFDKLCKTCHYPDKKSAGHPTHTE